MDDLISRSALLERLAFKRMGSMQRNTYPGLESAIAQVKKAPAVDAVEVVRCKDCEAWQTETAMSFLRDGVHVRCCSCGVYGRLMYDNDFCSKGKRRADHDQA